MLRLKEQVFKCVVPQIAALPIGERCGLARGDLLEFRNDRLPEGRLLQEIQCRHGESLGTVDGGAIAGFTAGIGGEFRVVNGDIRGRTGDQWMNTTHGFLRSSR